ncbi:MAG: hypothetical protein R3E39_16095 [Anaerolineae bacterium]
MKKWLLGITLLLLLATGVAVVAQDIPLFCGDLSEADCTLLKDSNAAMKAVHSSSFDMKSMLAISNIPDMPANSLEFHLNGTGGFEGGTTNLEDFVFPSTEADTASFFTLMADMLRGIKGDMSLSLEIPADVAKLAEDVKLPESIGLDFRMVDGVAYLNLAQIAAIEPKAGIPAGWVGIDLAELYADVMPQQFANLPTGSLNIMGMITDLIKPENVGKFVSIERLADAEIMGQKVAVFHTTINYSALLEMDAFRKMFDEVLSSEGVTEEERANQLDMIKQMYSGMSFEVTQSIGMDDKRVHSTSWTFALDTSKMPGMKEDSAPQVNMSMVIDTTDFNKDVTVDVPENAMVLPLKSMLLSQTQK